MNMGHKFVCLMPQMAASLRPLLSSLKQKQMQTKVVSIGLDHLQGDGDTTTTMTTTDPMNQNFPAAAVRAQTLFGILSSPGHDLAVTCFPWQKNLKCKQFSRKPHFQLPGTQLCSALLSSRKSRTFPLCLSECTCQSTVYGLYKAIMEDAVIWVHIIIHSWAISHTFALLFVLQCVTFFAIFSSANLALCILEGIKHRLWNHADLISV